MPQFTIPNDDALVEAEVHDFSSTQVNLPPAARKAIFGMGRRIPDHHLADHGREDNPHVTVKYGLHTSRASDVHPVLTDEPPVDLRFGKTSLFETPDYDVVKIDIHSPDLHRLNGKISKALKVTDTHPTYQPHATVAYVKSGLGKHYVGKNPLTGTSVTADKVTFTRKNEAETHIPLRGAR